jgi:hypothetical protein
VWLAGSNLRRELAAVGPAAGAGDAAPEAAVAEALAVS